MNIKPIQNEDDLHAAFERLARVYQAGQGTPEAIKFRMEQQGFTATDLELNKQQMEAIASAQSYG